MSHELIHQFKKWIRELELDSDLELDLELELYLELELESDSKSDTKSKSKSESDLDSKSIFHCHEINWFSIYMTKMIKMSFNSEKVQ